MIIYLLGFMGSGKSKSGKKLASALNFRFYDLDSLIESESGASINDIFREKGEEYFRDIEMRVLRCTGSLENSVIACGGGTPCYHDNLRYMNSVGLTIYLEMSPSQLLSRLENSRAKRPLLAPLKGDKLMQYITGTLEKRSHYYQKAAITVKGLNLDISKLKSVVLNR